MIEMDLFHKKGSTPAISDSTEISCEEIAFYYEEMVSANLIELEVETPQGKVVLKRFRSDSSSLPTLLPAPKKESSSPLKSDDPVLSSKKFIYSPIIGIFYRSSSPQLAPFVKEGESVEAGKTLCVIEAMKVMNEIKTESRCKILKILAENGKPISKEKPLFEIEPL